MIWPNRAQSVNTPSRLFTCSGIRGISRLRLTLCLALLLLIPGLAEAQARPLWTRHVREVTLNRQARVAGRLPAAQPMRIDIVLPLRDQTELENFLHGLYDPSNPSYRKFLTVQEFTARFGPSQEDYDEVIRFATTNGFTVVGGSRDAMDVQLKGSVATIEAAFHVKMYVYQHPTENRTFYAPDREPTTGIALPLWHVSGLDSYSIPRPLLQRRNRSAKSNTAGSNASMGSGPAASFLGSDMRAAYYGGTALTGSGQNIGLMEYYGYDLSDFNTYYANAGQSVTAAIVGISTDGTSLTCLYASGCDDTEQIIDMTQALGMAPGINTLYVYVGSTDTAILSAMTTSTPLPLQLSSSWTWTPVDPSTDEPYFQRMAAQGQSFFQASGDSEGWTPTNDLYPSEDPYVITVGGTDLTTDSAGGAWSSETGWTESGGGISPDKFAIPSWQQIPGVITSSSGGSSQYRNGPDVAANANYSFYVCADQIPCSANEYGGTSFAAPTWAGYIALANQQAASQGDSAIGFINPIIYPIGVSSSYDEDFHDVVSGNNGFPAIIGYDLITGLGSPNGVNLINALAPLATTPNIAISPTAVTVQQGSSAKSTITTTTVGGFDATVALTATGQPAGTTVSFSPATIAAPGSGSSTMTVGATSATVTGTYTISVSGTGGGITGMTTVSLTVIGALAPNLSPPPTTYNTPQSVTLTDNSPGVTIYYTTNGTTPTTASTPYTGPISVVATTTINAIAAGGGYSPSTVASGTYTILTSTPTFSPAPGSYTTFQSVTLADSSPGTTIYYTTNGTTPTTASTPYTGPIPITTTTTVNAIAAGGGYPASAVASGIYSITVAAPTFSPLPFGTFSTPQSVTLADVTPGVTIYYTTNGTTPTTTSTPYTGPISVSANSTISAIAAGNGYGASTVASETYLFAAQSPTMSPSPFGTFSAPQSVKLADATPGVTIYYTTNGTTPTTASTPYTGPFTISTTATISALAAGNGYGASPVTSETYTFAAQSPTMSPSPFGTFSAPQSVKLADATPGVTIYYTTNGTTPTTASTPYTGPFTISTTATISALAAGNGYGASPVTSETYTFAAQSPTMSPSPFGTFSAPQSVKLADATPGVTIYYTTNGTTPTTASTPYTGPFTISATATISAIAAGNGYGASPVTSETYTFAAQSPTMSPSPFGTFSAPQSVKLADATPGVTIYYTTNGTTPTTASTPYTGPFTISATATISAIAAGNGYGASPVSSETYTIVATAPTMSPSPFGTFSAPQSVKLADATPGVTIYYTTNGTTPTTASSPYTGPFTISTTTTIKAIAGGNGYGASTVTSETYTF